MYLGTQRSWISNNVRIVSVQKVVPTLTSRCAEIGLSMTGAKPQWDTRFILVLAVGRTSSRCALVALYCKES
jgi:hypothetical protein